MSGWAANKGSGGRTGLGAVDVLTRAKWFKQVSTARGAPAFSSCREGCRLQLWLVKAPQGWGTFCYVTVSEEEHSKNYVRSCPPVGNQVKASFISYLFCPSESFFRAGCIAHLVLIF